MAGSQGWHVPPRQNGRLSPYKSNGIFDRGRVSAGRGSMVGLQGCRDAGVEGWQGGVLQDGGYKGWFRAREGCG